MDSNFDKLIETQVEELLQEDDYYQYLATPLKPAALWKQDHRNKLKDLFKFKTQHENFNDALDLITHIMPSFLSADAYSKVKEELDHSSESFSRFMKSLETTQTDKPVLLQDMLGLSDETLLHIYAFGRDLVEKGQIKDALSLFTLLTLLAPHVESYWISQGVCMQGSGLYEEARASFNAAKFLNPIDPAPIVYSIECCRLLKDETQEKNERDLLEKALEPLSLDEQAIWRAQLK